MPVSVFEVQEKYAGSTIKSLGQQMGLNYSELAKHLNVSEDTPLTAGQLLNFVDVGSENSQSFGDASRLFTASSPYASAEKTLAAGKPITEQAYAERGRQLEAEKEPLKQRYQLLLDELTRREGQDVSANTLALAREYGKRNIPLSSGIYEQNVLEKTRPIREFYAGQGKEVGFEREDKLRELGNLLAMLPIEKARELNAIDQQIANLKAKGASEALQLAVEMHKYQREQYWREQELSLQKQAFELQKYSAGAPSTFGQRTEPSSYQLAQSGGSFYSFDPSKGSLQLLQGQLGAVPSAQKQASQPQAVTPSRGTEKKPLTRSQIQSYIDFGIYPKSFQPSP